MAALMASINGDDNSEEEPEVVVGHPPVTYEEFLQVESIVRIDFIEHRLFLLHQYFSSIFLFCFFRLGTIIHTFLEETIIITTFTPLKENLCFKQTEK